jgi:predicted amidohydrolase YtcJ
LFQPNNYLQDQPGTNTTILIKAGQFMVFLKKAFTMPDNTSSKTCLLFFSYCLLFISIHSCKFRQKADLIIHHAKIYTVNQNFDTAQALVVRDGKIMAIGNNDDILKEFESDDLVDAKGKFIYPGFMDAHAHFVNYGFSLQQVDLTGTKSWEDCINKIKLFFKTKNIKAGEWVRGRGWDQNDWDKKEFPDKALLDANFPDNPISLVRIDGHALIANQKALGLANVQPGQMLDGGTVETLNGKLTGILIDNAEDLIGAVIPVSTTEAYIAALKEAEQNCFATGLTSVVDCGLDKKDVDLIDSLQKAGIIKMKMNVMLADNEANYRYYLKAGPYKTERLDVNGFKLYADGALGSRGACLLQSYTDKPGWQGFLLKDRAYFEKIIPLIYNSKFQANTHAIGDSGNRMILQVYASALQGKNNRRWRVEHAQVVNKNDFDYFGKYSIIPSVQPTHATSDMYWAQTRLGAERVKGAYAYKQLLDQNGWIPLGTDFPVEDISPFKTFFAAVERKDDKGYPAGGYQMENALTRKETLMGMTIWAAKGSFEEREKGSLEKGKAADFILIDTDLIHCDPEAILKTKVLATYSNGERVFGK